MTLFVILICLGMQHFFASERYDPFYIFQRYARAGQQILSWLRIKNDLVGVILLLIPAVVIITAINTILHGVWFNSLDFLLNIGVLYYCLSACNIRKRLQDYFYALEQNNQQAAFYHGTAFLKDEPPADNAVLIRSITCKIFILADRYIFSVLFWYILFGTTGAVIYALINYLSNHINPPEAVIASPIGHAAATLQDLLEWIPVRLSGLAYALVGNFANAIVIWRKYLWTGLSDSHELAPKIGLAALDLDKKDTAYTDVEENKRALDLVEKGVVLWVVVIAICTLFSWLA